MQGVKCSPNTTNRPVPVKNCMINVFAVNGIGKEWLDDKLAEIDLDDIRELIIIYHSVKLTPGSIVNTEFAGTGPRRRKLGNSLSSSSRFGFPPVS